MKSRTIIWSLAVLVTGLGTVAYAQQQGQNQSSYQNLQVSNSIVSLTPNSPISTNSGDAETALAQHLKQKGAKMYGAYWCPYCMRQKELFGRQAFSQINYIECDPRGQNPRPELCRRANVTGFPTWEINGRQYRGLQTLNELADISAYKGDRTFRNQ